MKQYKVSVVIPNYNHGKFLKRRIDSVLEQTFQDIEIILLDDASSDNSRTVLRKYVDNSLVSHAILNQQNSGSAFKQWVNGIEKAHGKYIWIAESDDYADPHFLERLVSILDTQPTVGVAYCQSWIVDKKSRTIGNTSGWTEDLDENRWKSDFINNGIDEVKRYLIRKNTIPSASAVLFRKKVLEKIKPIDSNFRLCGDWMHWINMLEKSDVAHIADKLNYWRENTSNARLACPGTLEWIEGESVLRRAAEIAKLDETQTIKILFDFLKRCWQWQKDYVAQITRK